MPAIEAKLKSMGFELPAVPKPVASYVPAVRTGNLVFTSGQLPSKDGSLVHLGQVGKVISQEVGAEMARVSVLNALAAVKGVIGDLDKITRVVRVVVFVQSADGFHSQPQVANGASDFLLELFGEAVGKHARSAVGVKALPLNAPVELELMVEVRD